MEGSMGPNGLLDWMEGEFSVLTEAEHSLLAGVHVCGRREAKCFRSQDPGE